ncbi:alpha/beta-hydrolase [Cylindrobasidium torrendii FP15055 ss-10]|uniref:Alpha/beta-hydrolase n=1 Tax=Cylindrobasidium torrendii FP15055 ss-10 TaxID=1314674 RepID=A0A0D7BS74_9AGAR|nr:alpha/beta-hydrolase [Cylindrobasidium torrendii FP15055 ss-10]
MISALSSFLLTSLVLLAAAQSKATKFDWSSVPFNYSSPDVGTAVIALVRLPANVSSSADGEYRGPVLLNPGGPSGSGVNFVLGLNSRLLESLFGSSFDIVGFDPRGIGRTTPPIRLFSSDAQRDEWGATRHSHVSNTTANPTVLDDNWVSSDTLGRLAIENDREGILPHVTTDNDARDMFSIVEAMGREKLQYYGISYGSVLGATFAALFPEKIERMVLDGIVNYDNYFRGSWTPGLETADDALALYAKSCFNAGPNVCAFSGNASSGDEVLQNVLDLLDAVIASPVPVPGFDGKSVDFNLLKAVIFQSLYHPYTIDPRLSKGLLELSQGNGTLISVMGTPTDLNATNEISNLSPDFVYSSEMQSEALTTVACSDAGRAATSLDEIKAIYEEAAKISSFADNWMTIEEACAGWKIRPESTFRGPLTAANTSFPILFIGNTFDPVTPLSAAKRGSAKFPGSVVLTQNSGGHSSLSSPSNCSRKYVLQYFLNGTLPEPDTTCEVDFDIFNPPNDTTGLYF